MAYNRLNYLKRVLEVQDVWQEYGRGGKGYTDVWVYRNKIRDVFHISMRTFYHYLDIPAKKQIKEIEAQRAQRAQQLLF